MTILQNKDKDLVLAAELGKALLEKNEELSKENERIAEEFSHKLEVIVLSFLVLTQITNLDNFLFTIFLDPFFIHFCATKTSDKAKEKFHHVYC